LDTSKICSIDELAKIANLYREKNRKIIHCHGIYDLIHIGHIRHLQKARTLGDILFVTITPDCFVNRGPGRPVFNENLRCEAISALNCVDYVAISQWPTAIELIQILKPDFYVKGNDYQGRENNINDPFAREAKLVESLGGKIAYTGDTIYSSSQLINQHLPVFPKDVSDYLYSFSCKFRTEDILGYLDAIRPLRILTIGETIIDEYQYCETMGKSGKEPILASRYISSEKFAGGILAVANNASAFSDSVTVLTLLGDQDSHDEFIRERINPNIDLKFLRMKNSPTILKRRYIEMYPFQKLFELYIMNPSEGDITQSDAICGQLVDILPMIDVVIVTDYGHGMLTNEVISTLCTQSKFLAVNTQTNAANQGFNTISKYLKADYICISEKELRLDARSRRNDDLDKILKSLSIKMSCDKILVTRGAEGSVYFHAQEGLVETPPFTNKIVDRVGAGDTVLAVTAPLASMNIPAEVLGFIGNVVGSQAVSTVGHRHSIEHTPMIKFIESILKWK
jgi:rfaE bifunctional protein nucleotidyltransferase chain/domain